MSDRRRFLESNFTYTESENYQKINEAIESMSINVAGNIVIASISLVFAVLIIISNM